MQQPSTGKIVENGGKSWAQLVRNNERSSTSNPRNPKKSRMNALDHQRDKMELLAKMMLAEEAARTNYWKGAAEGAFESYWKGRYDQLAWDKANHMEVCAGVKTGIDVFRLPSSVPPPAPPLKPSELGKNFGPIKTPEIDLLAYQRKMRVRNEASAAAAGAEEEEEDEEEDVDEDY